ncbi:MAG: hypothetical protein U0531_20305 [Dehalococcoidia bacterium]
MLPSGNDAAIAIARHISGDEQSFVDLMNARWRSSAWSTPTSPTPHGLHHRDHYTSAYDIAQLSAWAMRDDRLRAIVQAPQWTVRGSRTYTVINLNGLLWYYPGSDGVKTGWHEQAGRTMVGSATRDGRRLVAVLLNDDRQLPDTASLLAWAFAHFRWPQPQS